MLPVPWGQGAFLFFIGNAQLTKEQWSEVKWITAKR
jgi:hypothetical protein